MHSNDIDSRAAKPALVGHARRALGPERLLPPLNESSLRASEREREREREREILQPLRQYLPLAAIRFDFRQQAGAFFLISVRLLRRCARFGQPRRLCRRRLVAVLSVCMRALARLLARSPPSAKKLSQSLRATHRPIKRPSWRQLRLLHFVFCYLLVKQIELV